MDSSYQSKMDFLIERAETTPCTNPSDRTGEKIEAMDLWTSVYENQDKVNKKLPHAPPAIQLALAERETFEQYCEFISGGLVFEV